MSRLPELAYITLRENGLTGPIPPEWGQLTHLEVLDLAGNELTGSIPPALDRLAHLERLDLGGNQLTDPIPAALGELGQLQALNLSHNRLTGPIPPELGQLEQLQELYLNDNELTGPIPAELGQPNWLRELRLEHNRLTDPIPPTLSHLLVLDGNRQPVRISWEPDPCPETGPSASLYCDKEVLLAVRDRLRNDRKDLLQTWQPDNSVENFEGVILGDDPRRVIGLEMVGVHCRFAPCRFIGTVPWQLSRLPWLERLVLRDNGLFGSIPPELGQLPRLWKLDLSGNFLRKSIPPELDSSASCGNSTCRTTIGLQGASRRPWCLSASVRPCPGASDPVPPGHKIQGMPPAMSDAAQPCSQEPPKSWDCMGRAQVRAPRSPDAGCTDAAEGGEPTVMTVAQGCAGDCR